MGTRKRMAARLVVVIAIAIVIPILILGLDGPPEIVAQEEPRRHVPPDAGDSACVREVREIYRRLMEVPSADSVLSFVCHVDLQSSDTSQMPHQVADVEITQNAVRTRVVSTEFEMDRDEHDVFVVVPSERTVFRSTAGIKVAATTALDVAAIRDTLLKHSHVAACEQFNDSSGVRLRRLSLVPYPELKLALGVVSVEFVVDLDGGHLRELSIVPSSHGAFSRLTWTFFNIRRGVAGPDLQRPVAHRFMNGSMLNTTWSGYTLVDNRFAAASAEEETE